MSDFELKGRRVIEINANEEDPEREFKFRFAVYRSIEMQIDACRRSMTGLEQDIRDEKAKFVFANRKKLELLEELSDLRASQITQLMVFAFEIRKCRKPFLDIVSEMVLVEMLDIRTIS